ncbi:MAG: PLP-dependent cysteine synthase family protein [Anaerolineae bacterium]|nr:PLP-dependent cysteine synthase family protein [Anaerolineae bacterium]
MFQTYLSTNGPHRASSRCKGETNARQTNACFAAPDHRVPAVISLIGNTPLVRLTSVTRSLPGKVSLLVKLEGMNPGGSVKDRAALFIVQEALCTGKLAPGKILIDATSGNTGIAYAMLGAALGFPVRLAMAANVGPERIRILQAYGAEVILTDPEARTDGARRMVRDLVAASPELYFHADQYSNPANPLAHYLTTGPEIWRQSGGKITHFVAGMGTSGTMMGVGRYLRERNPAIQLIGVQPDRAQHSITGLKYLAADDVPAIYDPAGVDRIVEISGEEAQEMARRLAREEGLFVGISAGAAVAAAIRIAQELDEGVIVALLPDGGFKYTSAPFWAE